MNIIEPCCAERQLGQLLREAPKKPSRKKAKE